MGAVGESAVIDRRYSHAGPDVHGFGPVHACVNMTVFMNLRRPPHPRSTVPTFRPATSAGISRAGTTVIFSVRS